MENDLGEFLEVSVIIFSENKCRFKREISDFKKNQYTYSISENQQCCEEGEI